MPGQEKSERRVMEVLLTTVFIIFLIFIFIKFVFY
jgi:hypothetical protein